MIADQDTDLEPFTCLCSKYYETYRGLHQHIKFKHKGQDQDKYKSNLQKLNEKFASKMKKIAKDFISITTPDIDTNEHDLTLQNIIDFAFFSISQTYTPQDHKNLFLDTKTGNQAKCFELSLQGEHNDHDDEVEHAEQVLIQEYGLEKIFKGPKPPVFKEFAQRQNIKNGKPGHSIFMKKDLALSFSLQYEVKIHLQLDIFAAQRQNEQLDEELQERIEVCQAEMWKEYPRIPGILKSYYQEVLATMADQ